MIRAIAVLVEAHLVIEHGDSLPDDEAFRKRFTAAMKLLANC
ncbi:hypothetical protein ACQR1N_31120 [Bradyrhizobium sp. HKCCYLRH1073]